MATILRYIKYFRQARGNTRFLNFLPTSIEASSRLRFQKLQVPQITKSYATLEATRQYEIPSDTSKSFENLEKQLNRSGRILLHDVEKVFSEVQLSRRISSLEGLLLIRSCGKNLIHSSRKKSNQLVNEIWKTLKNMEVPLDISHYHALLTVYTENNYDFSPEEFMQNMIDNGFEPNRITYQKLISAYCQKGNIEGATKILQLMKENDIPLCENVFNSLITGYSMADDMENALGIFEVMKNAEISPSTNTYSALICAYARRADINAINETLEKIEKLEIFLQEEHLADIILTFADNGHYTEIEELLEKFPKLIDSDLHSARIIVRLVDDNRIELAMRILSKLSYKERRKQIRSSFLIKQMITNKQYSIDEIIDVCKTLEDKDLHNRASMIALHQIYISDPDPEKGMFLLNNCLEKGEEIREHYFWPLLRIQAKNGDIDGILETLKTMNEKFKIVPSFSTLTDYVVPYMFGYYHEVLARLETLDIPRENILSSLAARLLFDKKLGIAATFMLTHPGKYSTNHILKGLVGAYELRHDPKSVMIILRCLIEGNYGEMTHNAIVNVVDETLNEFLLNLPKFKTNLQLDLLRELVNSGFSMSPKMGEKIKSCIITDSNPKVEELIEKLTSGNLKPNPINNHDSSMMMGIERKGYRGNELQVITLRNKFSDYYEKRDVENLVSTLREMEKINSDSPAVYAQTINIAADQGNIKLAEEFIEKFLQKYPTAQLDTRKVLNYATVLVQNDRFSDAIEFITGQPIPNPRIKESRGVQKQIRNLLDVSAETKHVDNTNQLFNFLKKNNYVGNHQYCLGPLIKVHILRNDLPKAVEEFEQIYHEYQCTPYKNGLSLALIEAEDANSLQKVTDLCSEIHGENNALVDLAFIFLESGRVRQAKKIFETPGIQLFNDKISKFIEKLVQNKKIDILDNLIDATRGISRMDRSVLYNSLMEVYEIQNDWQRGLALWSKMQEDNVQPTKYFLTKLSNVLEKNNQPIPFVNSTEQFEENPKHIIKRRNEIPGQFDEAILKKDWDKAEMSCLNLSKTKGERTYKYIRLVRALLESNETDRALNIVSEIIQKDNDIKQHIFVDVCDALLDQKRYAGILALGEVLNNRMKRLLDFGKVISKIQIQSKGIRHFIQNCDIRINENDVRGVESHIHFGELAHELIRDPSALPDFEKWAMDLNERGVNRVFHSLWIYHFVNDTPEAEKLWDQYIKNSKSMLVRPIIDIAMETKNPILVEKLLEKVKQHPRMSMNSICRVYSGLIMVYNSIGNYTRGLEILNEFASKYQLTSLSLKHLMNLKRGVENNGKTFPYRIRSPDYEMEIEEEPIASSEKI